MLTIGRERPKSPLGDFTARGDLTSSSRSENLIDLSVEENLYWILLRPWLDSVSNAFISDARVLSLKDGLSEAT